MNQGNVDLRKKVLRMCREYWEQKADEEKMGQQKLILHLTPKTLY